MSVHGPHLLDRAFLRKTLLELLLQLLPGAQGLLDSEEVRELLKTCVSEVLSKMIHALSVNWKELLGEKRRETVTQHAIHISASVKNNIFILREHLEYLIFGRKEEGWSFSKE